MAVREEIADFKQMGVYRREVGQLAQRLWQSLEQVGPQGGQQRRQSEYVRTDGATRGSKVLLKMAAAGEGARRARGREDVANSHVDHMCFNVWVDKGVFVELPPQDVDEGALKQCGKLVKVTCGMQHAPVADQGSRGHGRDRKGGRRALPGHGTPHARPGEGGVQQRHLMSWWEPAETSLRSWRRHWPGERRSSAS